MDKAEALICCNEIDNLATELRQSFSTRFEGRLLAIIDIAAKVHDYIQDAVKEDENNG